MKVWWCLVGMIGLVACSGKAVEPPAAQISKSASQSSSASPQQALGKPLRETLASTARGFSVGPQMGRKTVYVFFDPQCSHCGHLWQQAFPLRNRAHFVWVPVAFMSKKSLPQGVAILGAADSMTAMVQHEDALLSGSGGIDVTLGQGDDAAVQALQKAIRANTALMDQLGIHSVPHMIVVDAESDATSTHTGALPTSALAEFFGVLP